MSRSSIAARNLSKKFISTFFAATLALGLIPAAAFADNGEETDNVILNEELQDESVGDALASSNGEEGIEDVVTTGDDSNLSIPAATQRINQDMTLQTRTVAQAESTRSYFLAQTLESTRTVPIVSASLPLDTGSVDVTEPDAEGEGSASEDEGGEDSDESDLPTSNIIAADSVVVGSFTYRGITYAVEPGGESVAVVAADYAKLPEEFIEAQTIVLPSIVTADSSNYYSVTRIADNAFSTVKPSENEEGITAITIPASITEIGDDAFTNFGTLQYIIVSEDNPVYGMYDGCLYDADLTSLLLIPEGRLGAVWVAPSATTIDPEVFSHCALVDTVIADPDSAAYQLLEENDDTYKNQDGRSLTIKRVETGFIDEERFDYEFYEELVLTKETNTKSASVYGASEASIGERLSLSTIEYQLPDLGDRNPCTATGFYGYVLGPHYRSTGHEVYRQGLTLDQTVTIYEHDTLKVPLVWYSSYVTDLGVPYFFDGYWNGSWEQVNIAFAPSRTALPTEIYCGSHDAIINVPEGNGKDGQFLEGEERPHITSGESDLLYSYWNCFLWSANGGAWPTGTDHNVLRGPNLDGDWVFDGFASTLTTPITQSGPKTGVLPTAPAGKYFIGWSTAKDGNDENGTGTFYKKGTNITISKPTKLYAVYKDHYDVNWDVLSFGGDTATMTKNPYGKNEISDIGGSNNKLEHAYITDSQNMTAPVRVPDVANPIDGVSFKGWTDKADGSAPVDGYKQPGDMITVSESSSKQWYAVWTIDVNWNVSMYGGKFSDGSSADKPISVVLNTAADLPSAFEGDGWKFEGWVPKGTAASGATMTKPTITAVMAANNTDGVIDGYEGVWSVSVTYQRQTGAIDGMTITGASDSGKGTLTQSDIIYGTTVIAPTTGSPNSHHFSHWTTSNGVDSTPGDNETDAHTVVITAPGAITAYWAPNERKVELNSNDTTGAQATPRVMYTYAVYGQVVKPYPVNAAENGWNESAGKLMAPTRPGYEFAGYWNTQWDEGTGANCYLKADPTDKRYLASTEQTWDITNSTQKLYAHWKYKVYLSTNSWNSSGEQLTGEGAGSIDESSVPAGTLKSDVNGTYIETINGAPITLPKVTGRTGYLDSGDGTDGKTAVNARAWGVKAGSYGWATGIIPTDGNGATSGDPTKLTLNTSNITAVRAYDNAPYFPSASADAIAFPVPTEASGKSVTLFLNWENRAKVYDVALTSVYDPFTVSNSPTASVKAVYDAPILMERDGSAIVYADFLQSAATKNIAVPEKIVGTGADRHHEYIFKGFRTAENVLDGTNGTEYIGAKVTGTGANISAVASVVTTPWRIDSANPVLFAAYGRVKSTLTLNLNGGSIAGLDGTVLTVMNGGTEFTFEAGKTTPALPGAYGTAPTRSGYEFKGYYTEATGVDSAYAPYAEDGTNAAYYERGTGADRDKAVSAGLEWDFYTNITLYAHWEYKLDFRLDHEADCASSNPAGQHTTMTLMNAPVTANATDAYGNKYPVGGADRNEAGTESNLIVTALAGVPVMVPVAQNRNGYNDTYTWQVRQGDVVSGAARATVMGDKTNGYFTSGLPFAGITPNANTHTITAFVDWTDQEKTYWVQIISDQIDTGTLGTKIEPRDPYYIKVVFNDTFPVNADGNVLAPAPRDTDENRNLVFQGVYDAPAAIGDVTGTRYVRVTGDGNTPDAAFVPKTRTDGYRIEDALVTSSNADGPSATTHAIPVYARWAYPSCFVSFDMNTGNIAGTDKDKVENAFELQTNDSLRSLTGLSGDAAALATKPIKRTDNGTSGTSDYVFDGYWSAPSGGKQYYTKDLTAAPGITWDFAGATTLYAHWTYTVRLNLNGEVPASLQSDYVDGLSVTKANTVEAEPAPAPVADDSPTRAYAITVVWGADATVPATTSNVKRMRYAKPYDEASPNEVQNDYAFAGWLAAATDENAKFDAGTNVALGGDNRNRLTPSAGIVNLYAKWTCDPYRVTLDHTGGASLPNDAFAQAENGSYVTGVRELAGVTFDMPVNKIGDVLAAPHRLGYTFLGYYETPQASDPDHESVRYLAPTEGGMAATTALWPSHRGTGTTPTLYAHYTQNTYIISLDLARPDGETINPVEQPAYITPIDDVTYQTVLDKYSSSDLVITCEGYKFGGWYTKEENGQLGRMMFSDTGAGQGTYAIEDSITLYPKWTPRTVNVVWDFNLPEASDITMAAKSSTETYNQLRSDKAPAVPTVTGYTFVGWFRDAEKALREWPTGTTFRPSATDLSASEITYYAHWSANSYSVTLLPGEHGTYANMTYLDAVHSDGKGGYIYVHPYEATDRNWLLSKGEPEALPGWDPFGWEQIVRNEDDTDWVVVKESVDYVNVGSFADSSELTFRAKWTATKATVTLNLGECDGVECDPGAIGDFPLSFKYGIGMARTLPDDLNWPGHTFQGWQLTARDDIAIEKPAAAKKGVVVEAADDASPSNLEYTACWVTDVYTIEFVRSKSDSTVIAEPVTTGTDASGNVVALGRDTVFTFPKPTFRGGFTGGTVAGDVLSEASSYIFSHYKTGLTGAVTYLPGQTCTVADLLRAYPTLTDTEGRTPQNGSIIRLYAEALTPAYNVDVPLVVSITFDPDHVENSVKTANANLLIRRTNQTASLEVAGLICDPIAAAGADTPGTSGTFDNSPNVLDGTYLTLSARKGTETSAGDPVEINLGQVSRNAGKGVTINSVTATDGSVKSLRDVGFAFGGNSIAARTLNLTFGLRFDSSVDVSKLMFLNSKAFKDTGKTVPIARVYYTLALAR